MAEIYEDGTYLDNNPSWHEQDSPWKASNIRKIIERNSVKPKTICEVGCGAGEILNQLSSHYNGTVDLYGYEVSPQAFEICNKKSKPHLTFKLTDLLQEEGAHFDIVMAIDVFEHVEDFYGFLRKLKDKGEYKIFHIPLDLSAQSVLRGTPIMQRRKAIGHIHYFTKDTALASLRDMGYEIVDHFYTSGSLELPNRGWKANLVKLPRKLAYMASPDFAVRLLGGHSMMVLAK